MRKLLIILFASFISFAAHAEGATTADLIKAQIEKAPAISVNELKKAIDGNEPFILLDVREMDERQRMGIISQSEINIPRGMIEIQAMQEIPEKNTKIVVYCDKGVRSAFATNTLKDMGYTNVYNLTGGIKAWAKAGFKNMSCY
ncbi:MAG: rhodanese-like domain-containing protein [Thiotrichales bacterium]